jgi:hypothetical protein
MQTAGKGFRQDAGFFQRFGGFSTRKKTLETKAVEKTQQLLIGERLELAESKAEKTYVLSSAVKMPLGQKTI